MRPHVKNFTQLHFNATEHHMLWVHDAAISINFNIRLSQTLITFRRYFIVHIMIFAMMVWIISCFVCQHNFIAISVLHLALNPLHFFMIAAFARVLPHQMQQKKRFMLLHHFISRFFFVSLVERINCVCINIVCFFFVCVIYFWKEKKKHLHWMSVFIWPQ